MLRKKLAIFGKSVVLLKRREYPFVIEFNSIKMEKVIIDPHYEIRHSSYLNDDLILKLVKTLDGKELDPIDKKDVFEYYVADNIFIESKRYRLIWVIEKHQYFIGVINAYRISK